MRFGCFLFFLLLRAHLVLADVESKEIERNTCKQDDFAVKDKRSCILLEGEFTISEGLPCLDRYRDVTHIYGYLIFANITLEDPLMDCFPKLHSILSHRDILDDAAVPKVPAIHIKTSVKGMKRFSYGKSLAIFSQYPLWILIEAEGFVMDAESYAHLATRFRPQHLQVKHLRQGECVLEPGTKIYFMNELDKCEIVSGDIILDEEIQDTTTTNSPLHTVEGCIHITNTTLEMKDLDFLRNFKRITCNTTEIGDNKHLCLTDVFLDNFLEAHMNIADKTREKQLLKKNNGDPKYCTGICFAEDILKEPVGCKEVIGDIRIRKNILDRISTMHTLKGRLIVDGFEADELFSTIPKLKKIISKSEEPAVEIVQNFALKRVLFPDNLEIVSEAKPRIKVLDNRFYKMHSKQFNKLAKKYGKDNLTIETLEEKECYFPYPIKNISVLDNCEFIVGNLFLIGDVGNSSNAHLKVVSGCIHINGTSLTDIDFILLLDEQSGQLCTRGHVIVNNKELCAQDWLGVFSTINNGKGMDRLTYFGNKELCLNDCDREELYLGPHCNILREPLLMPLDYSEDMIPSFVNIEEIHGPIKVQSTDTRRLDTFISLRTIFLEEDEPAIDIRDNENLTDVNLSHLKEIRSPGNSSRWIVIKNNGNYTMPYAQYKQLEKKWGKDKLDIDHEEQERKKTDKEKEEEEEEKKDYGMEWGIGLGLLCGIACVLLIVATVMAVRARKVHKESKSFKKEEKQPLLKEKDELEKPIQMGGDTPVSMLPGQVLPVVEDEEGNAKTAATAYSSAGVAQDNVSQMGPRTAASAMIGGNKGFGVLANNASTMDTNDAKTAKTVAGGKFAAIPKENASVMEKEGKEQKALIDDRARDDGAQTARTVMMAGNKYDGGAKDNASVIGKEKNAEAVSAISANVGGKKYSGQLKDNASVMPRRGVSKGAVTATTANIGANNYQGHLKDNVSLIPKKPNKK